MLDWVKKVATAAENLYDSRRMKHAITISHCLITCLNVSLMSTRLTWHMSPISLIYGRVRVGWSMSSRMKAQLVVDALRMAIAGIMR